MADEPSDPGTTPILGPPFQGTESQGQHMLGANLDGLTARTASELYSLDATTVTWNGVGSVSVTNVGVNMASELTATINGAAHHGADPALVGLRFIGSDTRTVQVTGAFLADPTQELPTRYTLIHSDGSAVCSEYAVFVTDTFSSTRAHVPAINRLSIACEDGVVTKCIKWRYFPGTDSTKDAWKYHQACTRMANADYCGTGIPGTNEGTYISMMDNEPVRGPVPAVLQPWKLPKGTWPPPRNQFFIEAKWGPDGASCMSRGRWYSMDDDGPCPLTLPDPRKSADPKVKFCDDISDDKLNVGFSLISLSMFNDLPMFTWKNGSGDLVSTVRGYPAINNPTYPLGDTSMVSQGRSGAIILRQQTAEWTATSLTPMNMYCATGTTNCTLAAAKPSGMVDKGFEGYLFNAQQDDTVLMYQYKAGTDYIAAPAPAPTGYTQQGGPLGYVFQDHTAP